MSDEKCQRPGCGGKIVDGVCEDCGRAPAGKSLVAKAASAAPSGTAGLGSGVGPVFCPQCVRREPCRRRKRCHGRRVNGVVDGVRAHRVGTHRAVVGPDRAGQHPASAWRGACHPAAGHLAGPAAISHGRSRGAGPQAVLQLLRGEAESRKRLLSDVRA